MYIYIYMYTYPLYGNFNGENDEYLPLGFWHSNLPHNPFVALSEKGCPKISAAITFVP